jgi:hypothetical protein
MRNEQILAKVDVEVRRVGPKVLWTYRMDGGWVLKPSVVHFLDVRRTRAIEKGLRCCRELFRCRLRWGCCRLASGDAGSGRQEPVVEFSDDETLLRRCRCSGCCCFLEDAAPSAHNETMHFPIILKKVN